MKKYFFFFFIFPFLIKGGNISPDYDIEFGLNHYYLLKKQYNEWEPVSLNNNFYAGYYYTPPFGFEIISNMKITLDSLKNDKVFFLNVGLGINCFRYNYKCDSANIYKRRSIYPAFPNYDILESNNKITIIEIPIYFGIK